MAKGKREKKPEAPKTPALRAELVKQPTVTEIHFWGAHERVAVRRR